MGVFRGRSHREPFLNAHFNIFSTSWEKKNKLKLADDNTRSTGSAGKQEAKVNGVEEKDSLVQVGEGR